MKRSFENESDSEGIDLFDDKLEMDYQDKSEQDFYELDGIDDTYYEPLTRTERLVAEHREEEDFDVEIPIRSRRITDQPQLHLSHDELEVKGNLADYVLMEAPSMTIRNEFHRFLLSFTVNDQSVYGQKIRQMCEQQSQTLVIDYGHLCSMNATIALFLSNAPQQILPLFDQVAMEVVLQGFENYDQIHSEIHVRIANLPAIEQLRDLRFVHLNTLIRVQGVVTKRSAVYPQLQYVKYECKQCGAHLGPFYQDSEREVSVNKCANCQKKGPFELISHDTLYRNYQRLTLQESPGSVPAGRLPRHRDIIVLGDLVDIARPGEQIEVTGIYLNNFDVSLNVTHGFPVFKTIIEANHISKKSDEFSAFRLTEDDKVQIRKLSHDPRLKQKIINSIAPSIYGHNDIKTAIALAMFGGVFKNPQGKHRLRGDINVLLLGDPGTAKSQFLKYVEKTSHRAVYATGQGASAVGLTATVHKDPATREWTLEGGALVMADKGVCLIDEFDKMNDKDRTSIHEAMEQQSISVSKAGIVTTLHARCAVIAAANPIYGRYNGQIPLSQNVELTEPILSRFDIVCVVRDLANPVVDEMLARFVCNSHINSHPHAVNQSTQERLDFGNNEGGSIDQDLLKKYIVYARDHVKPTLENIDVEKLEKLYTELRKESMIGGAIPITVRYLESIIRMAEAFARMHLRDNVRQDDIDHAIKVTIGSFISAQKGSVQKQLSKVFAKYINTGSDTQTLMRFVLEELVAEHTKYNMYHGGGGKAISIDLDELEGRAREVGVHNLHNFLGSDYFRRKYRLSKNIITMRGTN